MQTRPISRRDFLKLGSSGLAGWALNLPAWAPRLAFAPPGAEPGGDVLVCVFLRGGLDGLNAVIPQFDADYYRLRPSLAIPESKLGDDQTAIDLDGRFGLHPALRPLKDVWDAGELAIIHAAGSPDPTHSHFDAMDYMERGTPGEKSTHTGWIGRHLQTAPWQNDSSLRAVGMGGVRQAALRGPVSVTSLQNIADFHLQGDSAELTALQHTLATLYDLEGSLAEAARGTLAAIDLVQSVSNRGYTPAASAAYPEDEFGLALKQTAQLVKAGVGLEVACIDLGGFDTHANQGAAEGQLAGLLTTLAQGLAAFHQDLRDWPSGVSLVTMSEFGRRAAENASGGTDHGHANLMLALGAGVNGGKVYADWPGLAPEKLFGPGDLQVTTDFRAVLAELVAGRLKNAANLAQVFPGYAPAPLGLFQPL